MAGRGELYLNTNSIPAKCWQKHNTNHPKQDVKLLFLLFLKYFEITIDIYSNLLYAIDS